MEEGWVKVHRTIKENKYWKEKPYTKGQAWIDLILSANHKDSGFFTRGIFVEVKRGQVGMSQLNLSKQWGWSRNKVKRFLNDLETEQQIEQQNTSVTSLITITNYDHFQNTDTKRSNKRTPKRQQKDTRWSTNKNEKNDKNEKKSVTSKVFDDESLEIQASKFLAEKIKNQLPTFKEPNFQSWAKEFDLIFRKDNRTKEQIKALINWLFESNHKDAIFWRKNILSPKKLRERFDQLTFSLKHETKKEGVSNEGIRSWAEKQGVL